VENDGVVPISNAEHPEGFLGSTAEEHPLHTDGSFRDNPEKMLEFVEDGITVAGLPVLTSTHVDANTVAWGVDFTQQRNVLR
jgi:hypothetical protein